MSEPSSSPVIARHFGLDWLRIGAFGLLILYHVSLYFGPTHWIVNAARPAEWVAWPVAAVVPWRLTLLFAVSGYATAAMMQRSASLGGFLRERAERLLVPLLFGALVIVPPQDWVLLRVAGVDEPYSAFLRHDFLSFALHAGRFMPNWEHLWFLPTLLGFTALLTAMLWRWPHWRAAAEPVAEWLGRGHRLLVVPPLVLLALLFAVGKAHLWMLAEYLDYFPAFLFGFAYAHFAAIRRAIGRLFPAALVVSLAALAVIWLTMARTTGDFVELQSQGKLVAEYVMSWAMMPVLFHLADRLLNRDHPLRAPLAAAVFPAYIVHQTVIVLVGWDLAQRGIAGFPAFLTLIAAVALSCLAAWRLGRASPLLGELLGMPHKSARARPVAAVVPAHEG